MNLGGEALLRGLPVEHLKDGLEVLSLAVLVLEAVKCESIAISNQAKEIRTY